MKLEIYKNSQIKTTGNKTYDKVIALFCDKYSEFTKDTVKDFINSLTDYSISTRKVYKAALKKFVKSQAMDYQTRAMIDIAFDDIKTPSVKSRVYQEQVVTIDELKQLLSVCNNDRDRLIIETLYKTGLRVSELYNAKLADCRYGKGQVFLTVIGKGSKQRRILLPESLFNSILDTYNGQTYLFETMHGNQYSQAYIYKIVKRAGRRINRPEIHPHTLRHSFATSQIKAGSSLTAVSNYLGHSSTSITADFYIHDELTIDNINAI